MNIQHSLLQIGKLHLTGHHLTDQSVSRQAYLSEMKKNHWPVAQNQRWYFIRQIHVQSRAQDMPSLLAKETKQAIQQAKNASTYTHEQNNKQNSLYFENTLQLLTALSIDLLDNQAGKLWYWKQYTKDWPSLQTQSRTELITSLWQENIDYLPSLIEELFKKNSLTPLWKSLSSEQHQKLLTSYCLHLGVNEAHLNNQHVLNETISHKHSKQFSQPDNKHHLESNKQTIPRPLLRPWINIVSKEFIDDEEQTILSNSLKLISLVILGQLKASISTLDRTAISLQFQSIINTFKRVINKNSRQGNEPLSKTFKQINASIKHDKEHFEDHETRKASEITRLKSNTPVMIKATDLAQIQEELNGISSQYGGLFYLINIISHPQIMATINKYSIFNDNFSGWRLLFQLGFNLISEESNFDNALLALLCKACRVKDNKALLTPDYSKVCHEISNQLVKNKNISPLWNEALLHKQSIIMMTQSHLDIFYSSDEIDLDIRLAGLDINPHWVPWLGRVVTFHYEKNN
ncbi:MAG: hypothetical protein GY694_06975 [Gammaproteobacteria bacterium]|nr:hypothetical protein [Gammaproteobacteria bacterium]